MILFLSLYAVNSYSQKHKVFRLSVYPSHCPEYDSSGNTPEGKLFLIGTNMQLDSRMKWLQYGAEGLKTYDV